MFTDSAHSITLSGYAHEALHGLLAARRVAEVHGQAPGLEPPGSEGAQQERSVFPLWQRLLKAPFVIVLALYYRSMPNKFALVAKKPA